MIGHEFIIVKLDNEYINFVIIILLLLLKK